MDFYLKKNLGLKMNLLQAMKMACEQAELGLGHTTPNPSVGAVVLDSKDGLMGVGYHKKYGGPHAEVEAFQEVYNQGLLDWEAEQSKQKSTDLPAEDSNKTPQTEEDFLFKKGPFSVFVTLEPCAHQGKTPSCAKMLAAHPLSKVIYLIKDPNELVAGKGQQILEEVGIKTYCVEDILNSKAKDLDETAKLILKYKSEFKKLIKQQRHLNRQFLHAMTSELPYVTLKWAQTVDGSLGLIDSRLMITNQEVQKEVHQLRAAHDIVMVGKKTVLNDNPLLNNRFGSSKYKDNKIVIVDSSLEVLKLKHNLQIFEAHDKSNIVFVTLQSSESSAYEADGYQFIKVEGYKDKLDHVDLNEALRRIKKELKVNSVFVEGGSNLLSSFLRQGLYNEISLFVAPRFIFKKTALRLNPLLWLKSFFKNIFKLKFRIFEDNLLINIKN